MCLWIGGPDYRLCTFLSLFPLPLSLQKKVKGEKIPNSHLDCFACFSGFLSGLEMLRVSIAALIKPTSFKVINLVGRNQTSRLGQARDGEWWRTDGFCPDGLSQSPGCGGKAECSLVLRLCGTHSITCSCTQSCSFTWVRCQDKQVT